MIDLATAKAWLKVETTAEDTLVTGLINAAVKVIESKTGKFLSATEVTQTEDGFPRACPGDRPIRLWYGPVADSPAPVIHYDDGNGEEQTLSAFRLIEGDNAKLLPAYGQCWPLTICGEGTVRVIYTAGYTDDTEPDLDQATLRLVAHWYLNREAVSVVTSGVAVELPISVETLIIPYRTPRLG